MSISATASRFLFGIAVLSLLLPFSVFAQSRVSLQVSPPIREDSIEPGTTHEYDVRVTNLGEEEAVLYPIARNITGMNGKGEPEYSRDKNDQEYELASWISYTESQLVVAPGKTGVLHLTVTFPKDAHPGSHMAGVFFTNQPAVEVKNGSAVGFEVGSILSFRVAGDIVEKTEIREFYTNKSVYGEAKADFTVRLENSGNVLTKPVGFIDITNMFGRKVASIPVNSSEAGVFPKTIREFNANWSADDLQFGRYEAVLALVIRGVNGDQTISRVVQFWILPMNLLVPVLGTFLFIVLVVYVLLRLYVRNQLGNIRRMDRPTQNARGLSRLAVVVIALLVAIILGLFLLFFYFG